MVRVAMNTSNFLEQTGLCKSSIAQSRMCCIALFSASGNPSVQKVPTPQASALRLKKRSAEMRSLHPPDAEHKGFGHSPTSILNLIFRNQIQKSCRGTTAHCLQRRCFRQPLRQKFQITSALQESHLPSYRMPAASSAHPQLRLSSQLR